MATISELEKFKMSDAVKFHKELNPNLWIDNHLDPEVKDQLLLIADDFISSLGINDLDVIDVTISGSNAAYSYTPHSDLDLHVIVDMSKLRDDAIYRELFTAKKTLYNDSHDITVHGVPVELYVQDANEPVKSLGEYSVLDDKWIKIPKKTRANFDQAATKAKFDNLADIVELALKTQDLKRVEKTIDTIKRYRKAGLEKGGEFGPENLAFKAIRSQGGIQSLYDLRNKLRSEKLSIEEDHKLLNAPTLSVAEIAEKHGVSRMEIAQQLDKGIKVELEHTKDKSVAKEIALDHLAEDPKYYTKLASVELEEYNSPNLRVWKNPSPKSLYNLTNRASHKRMRGMYDNGDTYWWDANDAIHADGAKELGIAYDYLNRLEAGIDSISGNYRVGGDDGVPTNIIQRYDIEEEYLEEENLTETTEESQLINLISKKAASIITKMLRKNMFKTVANVLAPDIKQNKLEIYGISAENLGVPYVNDPVLSKVLDHSKFRVVDYVSPVNRGTMATYDSVSHDITVYYPALKKEAARLKYQIEPYLAKTIAHEIQHAVDNVKSGGKAFKSSKTSYPVLPHEINARFQEALMNITLGIEEAKRDGVQINRAALAQFIDHALAHNYIAQYLPKTGSRYKQLVKRAYKFFEAEMNNPKREKPFNIVKRAMNYILEKPTSTVNEASGYIPSEKEKNDPRFKTALTVDIKPDAIKKNAKAFGFKTSREGIPPQARADGRITESIDFKAFVQYKENQFATEHDELMHILNLKDIDVILKHNLLEALGRKFRPLSEDTEIDVTDDDLKMLHRNYSADNVSVGNRYIPVEVGRYHGSMILYDVYKNSPPKHAAVFATVTSISENAVHMLLDDTTYRYPFPHYGVVSASVTLFIDSAEKYNNLRTFMQLKFGQSLPILAEDIIAESLMNEWNSFLSEDEQQGELFPGYDKEHKEKRLDNWLQNTHAWDGHKPRVFYHATTKDFDTFNTHGTGFASALGMAFEVERHGSFFAVDPKFAEEFIEDPNRPGQYKEGGRVISVYLSIQNPIDLRDNNLSYMLRDDETVEGFKTNDIDLWSIYRHYDQFDRWELFDGPEGGEFVNNLQKLGFDGAIIVERVNGDAQSGEVWVAFNPNQVKAIHNRGSFSPDDPRLMRESQP